MGLAQDMINRPRLLLDHGGHGGDGVLDALVGRDQAERGDDPLALQAEFGLGRFLGVKRRVGRAVRDEADLVRGDAVGVPQQIDALCAITTKKAAYFSSSFRMRRCGSDGCGRTVCSVTTTGMVAARTRSRTYSPWSPP